MNEGLHLILVGFSLKRQYPPVSLLKLQTLIDTNRLDPEEPIDIIALSNTKICVFTPFKRHFGFNLTDEVRIETLLCILEFHT